MSRAASLSPAQRAYFEAHVRRGLNLYGLTYEEAAKHDCRLPQLEIADSRYGYLACPCGRRQKPPTERTLRNALSPKRSAVSFVMALDVLKLINGATKTQRWRKEWRRENPGERDPWDIANGKLMPKYALRAGLLRERAPGLTALVTGR